MNPSHVIRFLHPLLKRYPKVRNVLREADRALRRLKHSTATFLPVLIRPQPRHLTIAVTAACNLRCKGCGYGRDYMVREQLPLETALEVLDDARKAGVNRVRFYGGEPLLHPDLPRMMEHSTNLGMDTYVNTNGLLLEHKIDDLVAAGMQWLTVGFYGVDEKYDGYTQRPGRYERLVKSLDYVRERYGDALEMQLNWLLMRPTCTLEALDEAWRFAERYAMFFQVNLISYSLPFFNDGPDGELPFTPGDRPAAEAVGAALLDLKDQNPDRFPQSRPMIRAIPDLLMEGPAARIPCNAYDILWIGADGTVQICDTAFELGNVKERRLRDILFGEAHRRACRDAFKLKCPNCTCKLDSRILGHGPSLRRYGGSSRASR